jgi:hypothetical protein
MVCYFHGSDQEVDTLHTKYCKLVDANVVFATPSRTLALMFIPRMTDLDTEIGFLSGRMYVAEQYPGAFNLFKVSGWIYHVNSDYFESHSKLGMSKHEVVAYTDVPIIKKEYIKNVYNVLLKCNELTMIPFEARMKMFDKYIKSVRK